MLSKISKAERTRQFIVERTAPIFNMKGFAGTSMADITEATGLTKGSIYGNFENKEDVAVAVFEFNYAKLNKAIQEKVSRANSYTDKILAYADVYDHFQKRIFPSGGCPVLNTAVEADDTNPVLKNLASRAVLNWKKNIELLFIEGVQCGEFKDGIDYEQMAISIIALFEGGIMMSKVTGKVQFFNKICETIKLLVAQVKR